jgi:hypothetical protein
MIESISLLEPLRPPVGHKKLEDLASEIIAAAEGLNQSVHPIVRQELGKLVRSMNCYYSNLIEGHRTLPIDIERALNNNFVNDVRTKNLQLEAIAHIKVQEKIDLGLAPGTIVSEKRICWLHQEFASHLPGSMLNVENKEGTKFVEIIPGQYRDGNVIVGRHTAVCGQIRYSKASYQWDRNEAIFLRPTREDSQCY